jgi:hypothetical protein
MSNLLKKTKELMSTHNKTPQDVLWVGCETFRSTWDNFAEIADATDCDNVFRCTQVAQNLVVVGKDWWLERQEYDGSEGWRYKTTPKMPDEEKSIKALTIGQGHEIGSVLSYGWETLEEINGYKAEE